MGAFKNIDIETAYESDYALNNIEIDTQAFDPAKQNNTAQPFVGDIQCGFPSPATDYIEMNLNLHDYLVKKPAATFFMRAKGDSMLGAGIYPNDLLIVDRSIHARSGCVVVASINGEFTLKRLYSNGVQQKLLPENLKYKPIEITEDSDFQVFGVVTNNIHRHL